MQAEGTKTSGTRASLSSYIWYYELPDDHVDLLHGCVEAPRQDAILAAMERAPLGRRDIGRNGPYGIEADGRTLYGTHGSMPRRACLVGWWVGWRV